MAKVILLVIEEKIPASFISTHLLKSLDCISISRQLILSRIPMTGPIIDNGGEAATLKTDKQYQYSCLLAFACLSLSADLAGNSNRGHFIRPRQFTGLLANSHTGDKFCISRTFFFFFTLLFKSSNAMYKAKKA